MGRRSERRVRLARTIGANRGFAMRKICCDEILRVVTA